MRRSIHFLVFAAGLAFAGPMMQAAVTVGSSAWTWQNPLPQGNGLNSVSCPTTTVCFAVGDFGLILATTNSGSTWTGQTSPTTRTLHGVSCANTTTCYAVGDGGVILKTDNGGTWFQQPSGTGANLNGISCPSFNECVAVGTPGLALFTFNSGAGWFPFSPVYANNLVAITCASTSECYAAGSFVDTSISPSPIQAVWKTTNPGLEWQPLYNVEIVDMDQTTVDSYTPFDDTRFGFLTGNLTAISIGPSDTPVVVTDHGYVFAYVGENPSLDGSLVDYFWGGGNNFGMTGVQVIPGTLNGISCPSSFCYFVGASNNVLALQLSVESGIQCEGISGCYASFYPFIPVIEPSGTSGPLQGISCPTIQCFAVGSGGAITWNPSGGTVWESQQTTVTSNPLLSTSCPTEDTCYTVGWNGTILASTNGESWTTQFSGVSANLQAIHCSSTTNCVAVGDAGTVVTTTGSGWYPRTSGTIASLHAVRCPSTSTCYTAGAVILSSTNGGSTWTPQMAPPSGTSINGIACTGASNCIAVGSGPVILTTSNGFASYFRQNAPTANVLTAISCLSTSTCIAVGNKGTILLSTNGGVSWSPVASPTTQDLMSVSCLGGTCYAGSFEGQIISSFNSGSSWGVEAQLDPNADTVLLGGFPPRINEASGIEGVSCASTSSSYHCLAVGSQGTILSKVVITTFTLLGTGDLTPSDGSSAVGEPITLSLTWTVPSPQVWRDLKYLDVRLADDEGIGLWARFIPGNPSAFALLDANGNIVSEGLPGAAGVLDSPTAALDLAHSSFEATGPTSPTVTVNFAVSLKPSAAPGPGARVYDTQLLITNVSGQSSAPDDVGHWAIRPNQ